MAAKKMEKLPHTQKYTLNTNTDAEQINHLKYTLHIIMWCNLRLWRTTFGHICHTVWTRIVM